MSNEIDVLDELNLNIEGIPNAPVCPYCTASLENVAKDYARARIEPDTRWFWCPACEGHLGYHRMKGTWRVDPHDLDSSAKLREHFGLPVNE